VPRHDIQLLLKTRQQFISTATLYSAALHIPHSIRLQATTTRTLPTVFPSSPAATKHMVNQTHKHPVPSLPLLILSTYAGFTTRPHYESSGATCNQLRKIYVQTIVKTAKRHTEH